MLFVVPLFVVVRDALLTPIHHIVGNRFQKASANTHQSDHQKCSCISLVMQMARMGSSAGREDGRKRGQEKVEERREMIKIGYWSLKSEYKGKGVQARSGRGKEGGGAGKNRGRGRAPDQQVGENLGWVRGRTRRRENLGVSPVEAMRYHTIRSTALVESLSLGSRTFTCIFDPAYVSIRVCATDIFAISIHPRIFQTHTLHAPSKCYVHTFKMSCQISELLLVQFADLLAVNIYYD